MPSVGRAEQAAQTQTIAPDKQVLTDKEMREYQKKNLEAALQQSNWRVSGPDGAAELLGVKATTLADRVRSFGIKRPARR